MENSGNWTLSATGVFAMFQPCTDKPAPEKIHRKLRLIEVELLPPNLKLKKIFAGKKHAGHERSNSKDRELCLIEGVSNK